MNTSADSFTICLHPDDDVVIAQSDLASGVTLDASLTTRSFIPGGHKVACRAILPGQPVHRYGQIIGFATQPIYPGDHVHTHNLGVADLQHDYAFGADVRPVEYAPPDQQRTWLGYARPDAPAVVRAGTRNYIAVISSVNCSAHVAQQIAHYFTPERLAAFANIDGVIALVHHTGCSFKYGGEEHHLVQRTLANMARHPNVGGCLFVGLGCESNPIADMIEQYGLLDRTDPTRPPPSLIIQELGGIAKTVAAGIAAVQEMLPRVNDIQRTPQPLSELMVAVQCGGSDGWSGVTANPLVGLVSDEIVRQGGAVLLGEVPEIYGAEQLLTRRAASREVGEQVIAQVRWWEEYARRTGEVINNNPSPGNKAGGLTTIYEKSLGAVAKGGSTPLTGVYEFAELVTRRGLGLMNTPGNDWIGVTGQVAGGCTLVLFTTGRGSVFGFKPAPVIKISTHSSLYARMADDMDLDAGCILSGTPMPLLADELLDKVIAVASGQPSKSEAQGVGEAEFCPWVLGGAL